MKYGKLTLGEIEAVINKLGGMNGVALLLARLEIELVDQVAIDPDRLHVNVVTIDRH